jgi:ankyrin repeat protein
MKKIIILGIIVFIAGVCSGQTKEQDVKTSVEAAQTGGDYDEYDDENDEWDEEYTPLMIASRDGNKAEVKKILKTGETPSVDALLLASQKGHKNIVEMLIKAAKPQLEKEDMEYFAYVALETAAEYGHKDVVKLLLKAGADPYINIFDNDKSPLMQAVQYGHKDIVEILINAPSNTFNKAKKEYPNYDISMNDHYSTVLKVALENGYTEIAKLLINAGANPDVQTNDDN